MGLQERYPYEVVGDVPVEQRVVTGRSFLEKPVNVSGGTFFGIYCHGAWGAE